MLIKRLIIRVGRRISLRLNMKLQVIHGPNLNALGQREPKIYGYTTLAELDQGLKNLGNAHGYTIACLQSNHEGVILDAIYAVAQGDYTGLIINPGGLTHTSVSLRDALAMLAIPIIEVHISSLYKREPFRHKSYTAGVSTGQITGLGVYGYYAAVRYFIDYSLAE